MKEAVTSVFLTLVSLMFKDSKDISTPAVLWKNLHVEEVSLLSVSIMGFQVL
jgi:hypothetical protein